MSTLRCAGAACGVPVNEIAPVTRMRATGARRIPARSSPATFTSAIDGDDRSRDDGGRCRTRDQGVALATEALDSGRVLLVFRRMVAAQGGDAGFVDDFNKLPRAPGRFSVLARESGRITAIDARLLGLTALLLGSARERLDAAIDHSVGVVLHREVGDHVQAGDPFAEVHYRDERHLDGALAYVDSAFTIQADSPSES